MAPFAAYEVMKGGSAARVKAVSHRAECWRRKQGVGCAYRQWTVKDWQLTAKQGQ